MIARIETGGVFACALDGQVNVVAFAGMAGAERRKK
jgi:hypothetical protein